MSVNQVVNGGSKMANEAFEGSRMWFVLSLGLTVLWR
ncbi:hypothetical protein CLV36_11877 [Laceyella sediminis]|uniref:Uncharacterized protein n=1 Tax=Laceyella sediminis TaxID=573074 RepID=A0ABX5EJX8_9BACL|nr:hypothetical protein CLV36_11877 [Laceyella sediminis]